MNYLKTKMYSTLMGILCCTALHGQWVEQQNPSNYHLYAIEAASDNVVYTGGWGGFLVKTTDGGQNWSTVSIGTNNWISGIQFEDENKGWICTQAGNITQTGKVLKTTDGGATWTILHSAHNYYAIDQVNTNVIYVGCDNAQLIKTTDGGQTWSTIDLSFHTSKLIGDICFVDANNGYIRTGDDKLLKTTDGGMTWTSSYHAGIEAIHFNSVNEGYYVTYWGKIAKTIDGGATFTYTQSPYNFKLNDVYFINNNIGYVVGGLDCSNGSCTQAPVILKTTDGGVTWIDDLTHPFVGQTEGFYEVSISPNGTPFISGSNSKIIKNSTTVLGVNNQQLVGKGICSIYPNPVKEMVSINTSSEVTELEILDINAKLIKRVIVANRTTTFSIRELPIGVYIMKGKTARGKTLSVQKLIKG